MNEIFCETQILVGVWTEIYLKDRINHNRNGNTFIFFSIYFKTNLDPHSIKQIMKSILVKRKNYFGNSLCNKYLLYWTKVHQCLFGKCIILQMPHLWLHITRDPRRKSQAQTQSWFYSLWEMCGTRISSAPST